VSSTISIIRDADAETLWVVRDRVRFMGEVAGTDLAVLEVEVPPGSGTPPHRHHSPQIFRVLSGELTFGLFESSPPSQVVAGAGTVVTVPPNVAHNYQNTSAAAANMLVVVQRSMAAFFRALGRREAPRPGPPSDDEIAAVMAACARHDITIIGAPPA
jgi:quercetin dioxygenase-like cupin family protein